MSDTEIVADLDPSTDHPSQSLPPFHLAVVVDDLATAREFYGELLGFPEGRSDSTWVDYDFFGHQFVVHERPAAERSISTDSKARGGDAGQICNEVDSHAVPVPHFGVVLNFEAWERMADRLRDRGVEFEIEPYVRFRGQPGEQGTMFFFDPSGNAIEIKGFRDQSGLFAK